MSIAHLSKNKAEYISINPIFKSDISKFNSLV